MTKWVSRFTNGDKNFQQQSKTADEKTSIVVTQLQVNKQKKILHRVTLLLEGADI
jgi:hypothetical protein